MAMRFYAITFLLLMSACADPSKKPVCTIKIGDAAWQMEVAKTENEREKGLMFRHYLPEESGMVFAFAKPRNVAMWMQNTYISLDIVFVNEHLVVSNIEKNAKPLSEDAIRGGGTSAYVIELNGGQAAAKGIKAGDKLDVSKCPLL